MSGALAQYRTPSRPLFEDVEIDNPEYGMRTDGGEDTPGNEVPEKITIQRPVMHPTKKRRVTVEVGPDENGEVSYHTVEIPAQRHVLDFRPTAALPSKHRGGHLPKLTKEQRRKRDKNLRTIQRMRIKLYMEHQADARALLAAMESAD